MTDAASPATERLLDDTQAHAINDYLADHLAPLVESVDTDGRYPGEIITGLGERNGFGSGQPEPAVAPERQLQTIASVGRYCGSTSFLAWCQSASAWYLAQAPQGAPAERYLSPVLDGSLPAGTGMSNFLKHSSGIEKIRLNAEADGAGYRVSGTLPWVSNLEHGHLLFTAAAVDEGRYIMFAIPIDTDGLELHPCPSFSGMEGTNTWNVRMKDVSIPTDHVLAHADEFDAFMSAVKPGLILTQCGMGLGVLAACLDILDADRAGVSTNEFLETGPAEIRAALEGFETRGLELARHAQADRAARLDVLRLRAEISEWSLSAAQSTALHVGARGYLMRHPAQRHLREAMFVAIVTPALKHLRQEIHVLEQGVA